MEGKVSGYKLIKEIYKGSLANIYLATRIKDGKNFAIKRIFKSLINDKTYRKYLNNEIYILNHIDSPYTIKFYHIISDSSFIYLVFEYCNGGDLNHCLQKYIEINGSAFPQEYVQHIMRQIISGFVYLHSCDIIHRDIQLSNMLVQFPTEEDKMNLNMMKATIKIADFGCAKYLKGHLATSIINTDDEEINKNLEPHIMSKLKRINDDNSFAYDQKADIWSLGAITYELLIGCHAFEANSYDELIEDIEKGEYRMPHDIKLSIEALSFISAMLRYNPETRLDIESLSKQYFITKDFSSFHNLKLTKSDEQIGISMIMNVKNDENSSFEDFLKMYGGGDIDIDPKKTQGDKPFNEVKKGETINKEPPEDMIGQIPEQSEGEGNKEISSGNIKPEMDEYVNNLFDEMNKNSFYIEPLLVPNPPVDNLFNCSDPITKYMIDL